MTVVTRGSALIARPATRALKVGRIAPCDFSQDAALRIGGGAIAARPIVGDQQVALATNAEGVAFAEPACRIDNAVAADDDRAEAAPFDFAGQPALPALHPFRVRLGPQRRHCYVEKDVAPDRKRAGADVRIREAVVLQAHAPEVHEASSNTGWRRLLAWTVRSGKIAARVTLVRTRCPGDAGLAHRDRIDERAQPAAGFDGGV